MLLLRRNEREEGEGEEGEGEVLCALIYFTFERLEASC